MRTIAYTLEAMMRLVVYAAILGAMYNQARMEKRTTRAAARHVSR